MSIHAVMSSDSMDQMQIVNHGRQCFMVKINPDKTGIQKALQYRVWYSPAQTAPTPTSFLVEVVNPGIPDYPAFNRVLMVNPETKLARWEYEWHQNILAIDFYNSVPRKIRLRIAKAAEIEPVIADGLDYLKVVNGVNTFSDEFIEWVETLKELDIDLIPKPVGNINDRT